MKTIFVVLVLACGCGRGFAEREVQEGETGGPTNSVTPPEPVGASQPSVPKRLDWKLYYPSLGSVCERREVGSLDKQLHGSGLDAFEGHRLYFTAARWLEPEALPELRASVLIEGGVVDLECVASLENRVNYPVEAVFIDVDDDDRCTSADVGEFFIHFIRQKELGVSRLVLGPADFNPLTRVSPWGAGLSGEAFCARFFSKLPEQQWPR